jgi:hypothetical protein
VCGASRCTHDSAHVKNLGDRRHHYVLSPFRYCRLPFSFQRTTRIQVCSQILGEIALSCRHLGCMSASSHNMKHESYCLIRIKIGYAAHICEKRNSCRRASFIRFSQSHDVLSAQPPFRSSKTDTFPVPLPDPPTRTLGTGSHEIHATVCS